MQEPMLLLAGLPFQPWHPAPPAGLLWLAALVASELDGSEDPQDPLCRN